MDRRQFIVQAISIGPIAYLNSGPGFPIIPNGGDITVQFEPPPFNGGGIFTI